MLTEGRGNCYSFAALYYELVRAVGFDAKAYTGGIIGGEFTLAQSYTDIYGNPMQLPSNHSPHGWVEIQFDGVPYIFDTELEMAYRAKGTYIYDFYMMSYDTVPWPYQK